MSPRKAAVLRDGDQTLREHLIATAARLIDKRGPAGLTVRVIAREAQLADGVLYNHFADKEELIAQALRMHVQTVMRNIGDPPKAGEGTLEENLRTYIGRGLEVLISILPTFTGLLTQPKLLARFHEAGSPETAEGDLHSDLIAYLEAEQRLGRIDPAARTAATATMIIGTCHQLVLPHLFHGSDPPAIVVPPDFITDLLATVLYGIAPQRRRVDDFPEPDSRSAS